MIVPAETNHQPRPHWVTPRRRRLSTARDVAAMLGMPLTSLYDRTRAGGVPGAIRIGRRILFDLDILEPWVDAGGDYSTATNDTQAREP